MNHSPDRIAQREQLKKWVLDGDIRRWREAAGHTRSSAARVLGVDLSTLQRWEAGRYLPQRRNERRAYQFYKSIKPKEDSCPQPPPVAPTSDGPTSAAIPDALCASTT